MNAVPHVLEKSPTYSQSLGQRDRFEHLLHFFWNMTAIQMTYSNLQQKRLAWNSLTGGTHSHLLSRVSRKHHKGDKKRGRERGRWEREDATVPNNAKEKITDGWLCGGMLEHVVRLISVWFSLFIRGHAALRRARMRHGALWMRACEDMFAGAEWQTFMYSTCMHAHNTSMQSVGSLLLYCVLLCRDKLWAQLSLFQKSGKNWASKLSGNESRCQDLFQLRQLRRRYGSRVPNTKEPPNCLFTIPPN